MSTYIHDGVVFDLDRDYIDVTGTVWTWSHMHNEQGEPLMCSRVGEGRPRPNANEPLITLPDLYVWHGPLIPVPQPLRAAMIREVLRGVAA